MSEGKGVRESKGSILKRHHLGGWRQHMIGSMGFYDRNEVSATNQLTLETHYPSANHSFLGIEAFPTLPLIAPRLQVAYLAPPPCFCVSFFFFCPRTELSYRAPLLGGKGGLAVCGLRCVASCYTAALDLLVLSTHVNVACARFLSPRPYTPKQPSQ